MKFSCFAQPLCDGIMNVQRAVASKATIPALEGILISTDGDKIILSGYDLEIAIKTTVEANVAEEGSVVVKARILGEIVRKAQSDIISIEVNDDLIMTVRSGAWDFTIAAIDANEYPELPPVEINDNITLNGKMFKSMVAETIFSVSTSDDRPVNTGILFEINEDNIRLVAVDSNRFAIRNEDIENGKQMRFIIPAKTLSEVVKLIDDEEEVNINVDSRHVSFNVGNFLVISRLLEGDFLDYSSIPDNRTTEVEVNTAELISSIECVSLMIDRLTTPVKCKIEQNKVSLRSETALGKAHGSIDCKMSGDELIIGFNGKFMLDALRAVKDETVKIVFGGPIQPIRIIPTEGEKFLYLIMPIRFRATE